LKCWSSIIRRFHIIWKWQKAKHRSVFLATYSNSLSIYLSIYIYMKRSLWQNVSFYFWGQNFAKFRQEKTTVNNNEYGWTTEYCCWIVASQMFGSLLKSWMMAAILRELRTGTKSLKGRSALPSVEERTADWMPVKLPFATSTCTQEISDVTGLFPGLCLLTDKTQTHSVIIVIILQLPQ
jgi:hypothetical protein